MYHLKINTNKQGYSYYPGGMVLHTKPSAGARIRGA